MSFLFRLVALAALFGLLFGFDEGVIAGALPLITKAFGISVAGEGFVTAAVPLGAIGGAILAAIWADGLGRRKVLILCSIMFVIGAFGSGLAVDHPMLVVARLVLGLAIGASALAAPMFLAELAPAKYRGAVVSSFQLMITVGILVSYLLGLVLEPLGAWRWMLALGAVPALAALIGIALAPESPRWLAMNGASDKATEVVNLLQPDLTKAQAADIVRGIEEAQAVTTERPPWSAFLTDKVKPVLIFTIAAFLFQQLSGINAVIYYAPTIMGHAGFDGATTQLAATVGIGIVNVVMTVFAMFIVDRFGRRPLFIIGFIGTALSLVVIAYATQVDKPELAPVGLLGLFAYIAFFAVSIGPLPWLYMAELFPQALRSRGMALASVANWSCNFAVVFAFPVVVFHFGAPVTFAMFGIFCAAGAVFSWFLAPETKGISLEEISADQAAAAT
tara:strand:+ start:1220 stop:2560 length:1341 start_codon:yes stop_codon:yes gene_type:complete